MSYTFGLNLAQGIIKDITVPKGTKESIWKHIETMEKDIPHLIKVENENYIRWETHNIFKDIKTWDKENDRLCSVILDHNNFCWKIHNLLGKCSETTIDGDNEILTNDEFVKFIYGLQTINVEPERWSREYFLAEMNDIYEVLRGRDCKGRFLDCEPLSIKQCSQVFTLFSEYLDNDDMRLNIPKGYDELMESDSYDGNGYFWCEMEGAVIRDSCDGEYEDDKGIIHKCTSEDCIFLENDNDD
jgi:hypothetical protein